MRPLRWYPLLLAALCAPLCTPLCAQKISTLLGSGQPGFDAVSINNPYGLVTGPDGALYFCEIDNHVIRRLDLHSRAVTIVAGTGRAGNSGDGGPATQADLGQPYELRFDRAGNLFFVDMTNHVVRRVDRRTRIITTVAGTGEAGYSGDGGPATKARFRQPHSIAFDRQGRLLICDIGNHRVRRVDPKTGIVETWLGNGERSPTPDGAPAAGTPVFGPRAIDIDQHGNAYLVLREGNAVYRIDATTQRIHRIAGTGAKGFTGDGGPALNATLNGPKGIALGPREWLYLADTENHAIRRVNLRTGIIDTLAGNGHAGDGPDGDPRACRLNRPHGIFAGARGEVYVGDSEAHRLRLIQ
jgi:sugar lactone lactonase YvrE